MPNVACQTQLLLRAHQRTAELHLDTRSLTITSVSSVDSTALSYSIGTEHKVLGAQLAIQLAAELEQGGTAEVHIQFSTSPSSSALQWLSPAQTAGKEHPYLFSQCQAIHARSFVPCQVCLGLFSLTQTPYCRGGTMEGALQDTPSVKGTYSAAVTVQKPLTALMSAIDVGQEPSPAGDAITFCFEQRVPIPSYLIALAVGELESRELGPRSRACARGLQMEGKYCIMEAKGWPTAGVE